MSKTNTIPGALKIKDNLWIKGNKIISYETVVGKIENDRILEYGKYSRTTTKHIYAVSRIMGLPVVFKPTNQSFWKFEAGVKCSSPSPRVFSKNASEAILKSMKEGEDLIMTFAAMKSIGKKDMDLLKKYMEDNEIPFNVFELAKKFHKFKNFA
jgi:hypothetical protein